MHPLEFLRLVFAVSEFSVTGAITHTMQRLLLPLPVYLFVSFYTFYAALVNWVECAANSRHGWIVEWAYRAQVQRGLWARAPVWSHYYHSFLETELNDYKEMQNNKGRQNGEKMYAKTVSDTQNMARATMEATVGDARETGLQCSRTLESVVPFKEVHIKSACLVSGKYNYHTRHY